MRRSLFLGLGLMASSLFVSSPVFAKEPSAAHPARPAPTAAAPATPSKPPAAGGGSPGETIDNAKQYKHCIALAKQNPTDGWEESLAWGSLGGDEAARHCGAIALIGLKQYEEAATRLEELAKISRRPEKVRAGMLAQAGQAWLLAKKPARAYADQTAALELVPGAPDLLVDRAESLGEAKNYKEALADLDKALSIAPDRVEALTYRATAKRYLDDLQGAAKDAERALALDPRYQDAWLESGIIKRLSGRNNEARQAWLKVLEIAPNSTAADSARRNIELLDVDTH